MDPPLSNAAYCKGPTPSSQHGQVGFAIIRRGLRPSDQPIAAAGGRLGPRSDALRYSSFPGEIHDEMMAIRLPPLMAEILELGDSRPLIGRTLHHQQVGVTAGSLDELESDKRELRYATQSVPLPESQ